MKKQGRSLSILLTVFTAAAIFAFCPSSQAQNNQSMKSGENAIMQGAKQMMKANKRIMEVVTKKGIKDADLEAAQKQMAEGYHMVVKGSSMMSGETMAKGQQMMKKGAKMMLQAQNTTYSVVKKRGLVRVCAIDLHECHNAQRKIERGALKWYFGGTGY